MTTYLIRPPRTGDDRELRKFFERLAELFSYLTNAGSPAGSVTPRFVGDMCLDTSNSDWYKSHGTENTDWKSITD